MDRYIDIVFDGPPSAESGRFVEVENEQGKSINTGEWLGPYPSQYNPDVLLWRLRLNLYPSLNTLGKIIHEVSTSKGFEAPSRENLPQKLLLAVSELIECMEEDRDGKPIRYYKCPVCGRESDHPLGEHGMNRKGIIGWLMTKFNLKSLKCPNTTDPWKPEGIGVELIDCIIRCLHMCAALGVDIDGFLMEKVDFNSGREHLHGGRNY